MPILKTLSFILSGITILSTSIAMLTESRSALRRCLFIVFYYSHQKISYINKTMNNPLLFFKELLNQKTPVVIWVIYLMLINMASLLYWSEFLSKIIFFVFIASAILIMGLYSCFGFRKILGLGHVFWLPLFAYLVIEMGHHSGSYGFYLRILGVSIFISLVIDVYDVYHYVMQQKLTTDNSNL